MISVISVKNYASISDSSVTVSESEIEAYYSKHKENYKRTASRDIEYVTFDVVPSEDDKKQTEKWILKTKEEFAKATDPVQFINHVGRYPLCRIHSLLLSKVPENLKDFVKKEDTKDRIRPIY